MKNLTEAGKKVFLLDHLLNVTSKLFNDKNFYAKIINESNDAIKKMITSVLQYEYLYKNINLSKDKNKNFKKFVEISPKYKLSDGDIKTIQELFSFSESLKSSSMFFIKDSNLVVLSDDSKVVTIGLDKIKSFVNLSKRFFSNIKSTLSK